MNPLEEALAAHRFLEGLDFAFIANLAECVRLVNFESGQFILRQGAPAHEFYLIRSGKVTVELFSGVGGPVVIQTLAEGDVLGWSWLIPPFQWKFDARAVETTQALAVDGEILKKAFQDAPPLGFEILQRFVRVISDRLEAERLKLLNLYAAHS